MNLQVLHDKARNVRSFFYTSIVVTLGLALIFEFSRGAIDLVFFVYWSLALIICIVVIEVVTAAIHPAIKATGSQYKLTESLAPLPELIRKAKIVTLVGGTFNTFTDRAENLEALAYRMSQNLQKETKLLILHPEAATLQDIERARRERSTKPMLINVSAEIRKSLNRIYQYIGEDITEVVRVYNGPLGLGLYRFDEEFRLTIYTYGRGASSPCISIRKTGKHKEFFDSIIRGVDELWKAESSIEPTLEKLREWEVLNPVS